MPGPPSEDSLHQHKLCGFFCIVLSVNSPLEENNSRRRSLIPGTQFSLFRDGIQVGLRSEDDAVVLLPIRTGGYSASGADCEESSEKDLRIKVHASDNGGSSLGKRKRKRKNGTVHGSTNVLDQLHALMLSKCLKISARLIRVSVRDGASRAVVLVDVYLPFSLWSGWQFPKSRAVAASLFRHLSCKSLSARIGEKCTHM